MNKQEFGKRLNDARKKIGMKTETLAEEIDVSVGFLHDIFRGRTYPSVETFVKLVNALGCSANELLRGEPWPVDETALDSRLLSIRGLPPNRARHVCNVLDAILTDLEQAKECAPSEK